MFGLPNNLSYATAKAAVIGLTRSLTTAGAAHGIKVNLIAPAAMTRMAGQSADEARTPQMAPDLVAPMVAFLAHEDCPVSGEIYAAGAGRFARIFIASTEGYVHRRPEPTIEDVAENWATINDEDRLLRAHRPHHRESPDRLLSVPAGTGWYSSRSALKSRGQRTPPRPRPRRDLTGLEPP